MEIITENDLTFNQNLKEHKMLALKVNLESKYKPFNPKKAQRCRECGDYLHFEIYQNIQTQETKKRLKSANFCDVRWCPMCAWRKCRKLANELKSVLQQIEADRKVAYLFLTLSVRNPKLEDLKTTIKSMSEAFVRLTKSKQFQKSILGYIRAIELIGDKTQSDEAHPHYHCILVVKESYYFQPKNYISQAKWLDMWQKALRIDYKPTANIKRIKSKNTEWKDSDSAIYETIKYIAKPAKLEKITNDDFSELDRQTKGTRQYNKGGIIKQYKPKEGDTLDPEIWKLMEEQFYKWSNSEYAPKKTKTYSH